MTDVSTQSDRIALPAGVLTSASPNFLLRLLRAKLEKIEPPASAVWALGSSIVSWRVQRYAFLRLVFTTLRPGWHAAHRRALP